MKEPREIWARGLTNKNRGAYIRVIDGETAGRISSVRHMGVSTVLEIVQTIEIPMNQLIRVYDD